MDGKEMCCVYGPDGRHRKRGGKSGAGFKEYENAAAFARARVDKECTFTEQNYTEGDKPPFDSADCHNDDTDENDDNDKETNIDVMTKSEFA